MFKLKTLSIIFVSSFILLCMPLRQAYASTCIADINSDGIVDLRDYSLLVSNFFKSGIGDINADGIVDLRDYSILVSEFFNTCPTPTPTNSESASIGPIDLSYVQGGIWLTPEEIQNIPTDNASWDSLVDYAQRPMNIVNELICTAGGACSDTKTTQAMYARAIVGMRTNNQAMIQDLKDELDLVDEAVTRAIDELNNQDEKWAQRNIAFIALAANIIDYRPPALLDALHRTMYEALFDGDKHTIRWFALNQLPNKPAQGRWSLMATAYILEDWDTINTIVKAHAKAMGETKWDGQPTDYVFSLTGLGDDDDWQTVQPGGKNDPIGIMPVETYYNDHGVGGLYLADQYRAEFGPIWPPTHTDYTYEGLGPNIAIAWAADHLGFAHVFELGDYALLRAILFSYSSHDGKSTWEAVGNDTWQLSAVMTWAEKEFGSTLPDYLKPEPDAPVPWPLPFSPDVKPGRSMGFMYATHYARLME